MELEFKGTKGEWIVKNAHVYCDEGVIALNGSPRTISEDRLNGESWTAMRYRTSIDRDNLKRERECNMKLIASAPELLDALQDLVKYCEENKTHAELSFAKQAISNALK